MPLLVVFVVLQQCLIYYIAHTFNFFGPVIKLLVYSDPVVNSNTNERSNVKRLLEKLILEEDQFDVRDILPNTLPDPSSLLLQSDYACPVGQVVMAPDCGNYSFKIRYNQ